MNRRTFLKWFGLGATLGFSGLGGYALRGWLDTGSMTKPLPLLYTGDGQPVYLVDYHFHGSNKAVKEKDADGIEKILTTLSSPRALGLTEKPGADTIFTFSDGVNLITDLGLEDYFEEITPGHFARFGNGFFFRDAEVRGGFLDFIALCFEGDEPFKNHKSNPFYVIDSIHERNGLVSLSTPYSVQQGSAFGIANEEQAAEIKKICPHVDFIEVHNAYNKKYLIFDMRESNQLAWELSANRCFDPTLEKAPGIIGGGDGHHDWALAGLAGFYTNISNLVGGQETFKKRLQKRDYIVYGDPMRGPYVTNKGFTRTMVFTRIKKMLGLKQW